MKTNNRLALLIAIIFTVSFVWANLDSPKRFPSNNTFSPTPSPIARKALPKITKTPLPTLTPMPLLSAIKDTTINISATNANITVPQGSKYKTDYRWSLNIYPTPNLEIMMCWGCQPIGVFAVCGPGYGMGVEGLCTSDTIFIGDWEMNQHSFINSNSFAFIAGPSGDSYGKSGSEFISITTKNHQYPTSSEKRIIENILSGITQIN